MAVNRGEFLGTVTLTVGLWTFFVPNLHSVRVDTQAVAVRRSELLATGTLVVFLLYADKLGGDRSALLLGLATIAGLVAMTEWAIRQVG